MWVILTDTWLIIPRLGWSCKNFSLFLTAMKPFSKIFLPRAQSGGHLMGDLEMELNGLPLDGHGPSSIRLHVSGLGPSVTPSDLERTFSALGRVRSVDMVRTKGRNFAYMNFEAASSQDLRRFFSLYNGCSWKGGRLKLEKAREHYLDKLHREWADQNCATEQSEMRTPVLDSSCLTKTFPNAGSPKVFNIYFPRLRRLKKVPEKGLGKHKRSFERVDALPCSLLQVCSCQCCNCSTANQGKQTAEPFEPDEKHHQNVCIYNRVKTPGENLRPEEINLKGPVTKKRACKSSKHIACLDLEKSDVTELKNVPMEDTQNAAMKADGVLDNKNYTEKEMEGTACKRLQESGCIDVKEKKVRFSLENNIIGGKGESGQSKGTGEGKVELNMASEKLVKSDFDISTSTVWVQKASWKSLVGETGRVSFSLGNMLGQRLGSPPASARENGNFSSMDGYPSVQHIDSLVSDPKHAHANMTLKSSDADEIKRENKVVHCRSSNPGSESHQSPESAKENPMKVHGFQDRISQSTRQKQQGGELVQTTESQLTSSVVDGNDKICTFMRSANSEQEWLESKRIVKEMVKRTRKDALRSRKMFSAPRYSH